MWININKFHNKTSPRIISPEGYVIYYDTDEKSFEVKQGKIIVKSIIDYGKKEVLSGVKINLYKINGLSPVLVQSDSTDKQGEVIFDNIQDGSYRVIEIVDKRYLKNQNMLTGMR